MKISDKKIKRIKDFLIIILFVCLIIFILTVYYDEFIYYWLRDYGRTKAVAVAQQIDYNFTGVN